MSDDDEVIKHPRRMAQLKSFRELLLGGHTPSDIDVAFEMDGKVFIFGELKHKSADVPMGQRLLLQHIGQALVEAEKNVLIFIAEHDTEPDEVINVGKLEVIYMWYSMGPKVKSMEKVGRNAYDVCIQYLRKFIPELREEAQ